jgi:hypothetical protein
LYGEVISTRINDSAEGGGGGGGWRWRVEVEGGGGGWRWRVAVEGVILLIAYVLRLLHLEHCDLASVVPIREETPVGTVLDRRDLVYDIV